MSAPFNPPTFRPHDRDSRRGFVDEFIDALYDHPDFARPCPFLFDHWIIERVYNLIPRYDGDQYFQITVAWPEDVRLALVLMKAIPRKHDRFLSVWDYHKRLAAACILVRMRERAKPHFGAIDHSRWVWLGWYQNTGEIVCDLWGCRGRKSVAIVDATGRLDFRFDEESSDLRVRTASRRLVRWYYGPETDI